MKLLVQTLVFFLVSTTLAFADVDPEKGLASYYDDSYHGRKTISGEIYDKTKLTAAHKTLPFGTKVRVYNPTNKKSVDVTIIDRGPFIKGRVIELSRRAAQQIDLIKATVAPVELTILSSPKGTAAPAVAPKPMSVSKVAPNTAPKAASTTTKKATKTDPPNESLVVEAKDMKTGGLYKMQVLKLKSEGFGVQVAGYSDYQSVVQQLAVLQKNWFKGATVFVDELNGKPYYKVILGPLTTRAEADSYCESIKEKYKVKGAFVVDLKALADKKR